MNTQYSTGVSSIFLIVILTVIAIVLIVWFRDQIPSGAPMMNVTKPAAQKQATATPETELSAIDLNGLDTEFQAIDTDINSL